MFSKRENKNYGVQILETGTRTVIDKAIIISIRKQMKRTRKQMKRNLRLMIPEEFFLKKFQEK